VAFDLNEKPWYVALITGLILGIVFFLVMNSYVFKPIRSDMTNLNRDIEKLNTQIRKGRAAKRNLPKLEEDIRNLSVELDRLRRILPTRRETDTLLKKLKQLAEIGHFEILRFTPKPFIDKDFYWEWPINVALRGTYHELGLFFDRLSRFSRIINVSSLSIKAYRHRGSDYTIQADFTQQTFIYKEDSKGNGRRRAMKHSLGPMSLAVAAAFILVTAAPAGAQQQSAKTQKQTKKATSASGGGNVDVSQIEQILKGEEKVFEGGTFTYNPAGRRDPFVSLAGGVQQNKQRGERPPGLPGMLIDELKLEGIVQTPQGTIAFVQGRDKLSYILRAGTKLYDGEVEKILPSKVIFKQQVNDPKALKPYREVVRVIAEK